MDARFFVDPTEFVARAQPFLLEHEAENNLLFGLAHDIASGRYTDAVLATVEHDTRVVLAALMTPPHNLVVSTTEDPQAIAVLARALREASIAVPGVNGRAPEADAFVAAWSASSSLHMAQRIYRLDHVEHPVGVPGAARAVAPRDEALLAEWLVGFSRDALGEVRADDDAARGAAGLIAGGADRGVIVWEDGDPVSMAAFMGPTPSGIRIGAVFTPPEYRGKGYASACVAALSQRMLDEGRRFCFLYTDAANPTSNHIYSTIGYRFVCDARVYRFD